LNSIKILLNNKGSIYKKHGSDNVLVYSLRSTKDLNSYLIPYYRKYVAIYSSQYKYETFKKFAYVVQTLKNNSNLSKNEFINLVKLVYTLNPNSKGKQRKRTLLEVITIIQNK
jgi:hypothetical protein